MDVVMNSLLDWAFTEAEIKDVVMNWDGYKSSLPGRFTMAFFKNFKEEIMVDLLLEVENPWGVSMGDGLYINPLQFSDEGFFVSLEQRKMEGLGKTRDDEYQNKHGSGTFEGPSGDDQDAGDDQQQNKKKKYHRHTRQQIKELEALFNETPHPDEEQRLDISKKLGLETDNVKFWFQNKRTQMKEQLERHENKHLRQENEKLRVENYVMHKAMENATCNKCDGTIISTGNQLILENSKLKDQLNQMHALISTILMKALPTPNSGVIGRYEVGGSSNFSTPLLPMGHDLRNEVMGTPLNTLSGITPPMELVSSEAELKRSMLWSLALAAMDELIKMAEPDSPLWIKSSDGGKDVLNQDEYARIFSPYIGPNPIGYVTEASRETGLVLFNSLSLVETLMDADRWPGMFPSMVGKAVTVEVISSGMNGYISGALIMMQCEVQLPSPLVPVREWNILRFCQQYAKGVWVVVDVSIDNESSSMSYKRLPSGCIVHGISNSLSKITWVDHSQYDESVVHQLYRPLVNSGIGFGAQRWVATLQRQCEFIAMLMSCCVPSADTPDISQGGRRNMLRLAQRMANYFLSGICASSSCKWDILHMGNNGTRFMSRKHVNNLGEDPDNVISVTTSVLLPVSRKILFDFLRKSRYRGQWNMFSNDIPEQEILHLSKGQKEGNCVSVLGDYNNVGNENIMSNLLWVQDSCDDTSGSMIVYSPINVQSFNMVVNGEDSVDVPLLPSGFVILPDGARTLPDGSSSSRGGRNSDGGKCLLTLGFQMNLDNNFAMESVDTMNGLISCTIEKIKEALLVA
ncbi:homeobox-leucine zipper protein ANTHOCYANINLESS 2-like [Lotus japonicus]|uniref:homeobox-leucine zipper protein ANTHOCYANINLESS 2-like n=1 Tax=Lotus japonicus TaxID=34305 RepID=UPI0025858EF1|nr:homeobox-leucine zipper protein ANTHOCYANINLESS 2-like [Lotus japonicus]